MTREERYEALETAAYNRATRQSLKAMLPWVAVVVATLGIVWLNAG